jgi:phosphoglycerate dehydrogenase-like enzyme
MTTDHVLVDLLDETIAALALMDAEKLEALGERVELLSQVNVVCGPDHGKKTLTKKRVLEILLENSESNLRLLERLYKRGTTVQWEH